MEAKVTTHHFVCENMNLYQDALAAGTARGRQEEHQRACKLIRQGVVEIARARFPLIANFVQECLGSIEHLSVLLQCNLVISTAWEARDVLRFLLALEDMHVEE